MSKTSTPNHASPVGLDTHGHHRPGGRPGPRCPFQGRIGTPAFPAEPGRHHLYVAAVCPYAQRAAVVAFPVEPSHADRDRPRRRAAV
ncbi:hypothetical protein [Streptosporangium sp. OZ121]|uniref:hypothetical protein n=1 Tax=Streptosporangium sp. OZ121 TaxID=3444183 RepID=UPI003F79E6B9